MKYWLTRLIILVSLLSFSQTETNNTYFDLNYFGGNIALHNNDILHLITGRPDLLAFIGTFFGFLFLVLIKRHSEIKTGNSVLIIQIMALHFYFKI
jgi:hypothetical protein